MKKVYYAHAINIYGSKQEKQDIELLKELGLEVLNPNKKKHQTAYQKHGMRYFVALVSTCDIFAFRGLPDGKLPAGIAQEYDRAISGKKLVIELPSAVSRRKLSIEQTREYLSEVGYR